MNPEVAVDILKSTVVFALMVVGPFLIIALVVGLASSLFQSVTSMQEQSLTFAPKIVAIAVSAMLMGPWLLHQMSQFAIETLTRMGTLAY
jgi:flagellar biosynthetic protein FliQ